ncbi:conserved protein, unknown function [Hepatocystis sp. ex Piliocolobus tephrosceles]|nr:conserved protein, unknown function [Hepatocystis sp. ex Piliocolobus tephrosceles]VWU49020.1 conserved protein, unknown function [Hepatocystis sp. ex Piliocolobus tephrosceles]VWU50338.1 conserved protein, unknown function [Hepatocystis sp. ex Piliocolobus tephrosceles]
MNNHMKLFYFLYVYLQIALCLCGNISSSLNGNVVEPVTTTVNAPNGPIHLPADTKLKLGLRKYKYNIPDDNKDNDLKREINKDAEELENTMNKANFPILEPDNYSHEELHYDMPAWIEDMIILSNKSKGTLESLGLENLPDFNECKKISNFQEQILCIVEALEDIKDTYQNAKDITSLTARVLAGGRLAVRALSRLQTLASTIDNKQLMKKIGTPMATLILLQRETTSDRTRWLCGSILTLLTDLPVVSDIADVNTGSYGHVNVIMPRQSRIRNPDRTILRLREGVSPSDLINGYTSILANYTI